MTNVGDVHNVLYTVAKELERSPKKVGVEERSEISDVRVVVDGRAAGVKGQKLTR